MKRIVALRKPTATVRPPTGKGVLWRLVSHLSLNYLSLVEEGKDALTEILRLYNFSESAFHEKQIAGLLKLKSQRHFARVVSENGIGFVRGRQVEIEFDEEQYVGGARSSAPPGAVRYPFLPGCAPSRAAFPGAQTSGQIRQSL